MLEQIYLALENKCLINPDQAIVLGVSGGPDSLCMLESMHQLGYRLIVAHLDHALRPSSVSEREKIEQISERKGLPFIFQREDVASFAQKNRQSLEEAARTLRYRFLLQQAEKTGAQAVAVGHTADDQVETVLMHFLRGSGLSGLRGMDFRSLPNPWSTHIPLVRPLLGIWREEILAFLKQHDLEPNLDESNQDLRFYRNRLRNELIPRLDELNPGLRERIWQTAGIISADDEALDMVVDRIWMKLNIELGAGYLSFEGESLKSLPPGIQRRVIRRAIAALRPGLRDFDFKDVERAREFVILTTRSQQIDLSDNLRLEREGQLIWLADWATTLPSRTWPGIEPRSVFLLNPPDAIELPDGWQLRGEISIATPPLIEKACTNPDPWQAWLDLDRLQLPLVIRPRLPGDRIRPLGMQGHTHKLSDYMINVRIPRRARSRWPLVVSAQEIAWLPGHTISESFAVKPDTQRLLNLRLKHERRIVVDNPAPS